MRLPLVGADASVAERICVHGLGGALGKDDQPGALFLRKLLVLDLAVSVVLLGSAGNSTSARCSRPTDNSSTPHRANQLASTRIRSTNAPLAASGTG